MTEPSTKAGRRLLVTLDDAIEAAAGPREVPRLLRYAMVGGLNDRHMAETPDGEYVRYADVEATAGPRHKHERCGFTLECPCWTDGASVGPMRKASE